MFFYLDWSVFSSYNSTQLPSPSRQQYTRNQLISPPLQGDTYQFVPTPLSSATQFISQGHRIGGSNQRISPQIPDAHQNHFVFASNSQQTGFQKSSRLLPQFTYQQEDKTRSKSPDFKLLPQNNQYKLLSFPNISPTRSPPHHTVDEIQTSQLGKGVLGRSQDNHQYAGDVPNLTTILSSIVSKPPPPHTHTHQHKQNKGSKLLGSLDTFIQRQTTGRSRIGRNPNEHEIETTEASPTASLNGILSSVLGPKPKVIHRGKPASTNLQNTGKNL